MNKELKRYLISSGITFLSAFLLVVANNLTVEGLTQSGIIALLVTALRAAIKAVAESTILKSK